MRGIVFACLLLWTPVAFAEVRSLPVLTVTLYPGDAISAGILRDKRFTGTGKSFAGYVQGSREIEGKFARRTIVAGLPIPRAALKDRDVVLQGSPTLALLKSGGLTITTMLVPLEPGAAGELIRTRNPESGTTVMATAQSDGTLRVSGE
jgi:flagella basal body P-ring formation protein FlgA